MIKILQVVGLMNRAGMETLIMNIYRNIDRSKIQFEFCVHTDKEGDYDIEIINMGGIIHRLSEAAPANFFKLFIEVDSFFKEHHDYTAVHVHYSCVGLFYFHAAKKYGIAHRIYHAHNSSREKGVRGHIRYCMEQLSVKGANCCLACSDLAAEYNFGNRTDFIIINNGVDVEKFRFKRAFREKIREEHKLNDKLVCVHAGRFDVQKNHFFLLEAFEEAFKDNNRLYLMLLGNGPLLEDTKNKIKSMECRNNVSFLGNRDDISELFSAADLFLLPSLYEGLPLVLVEAQASGLKCIVSDRITKQAVLDEENVIPLPITDKKLWAAAINEYRKYSDARSRIYKADKIRELRFDSGSVAKDMQSLYMQFVSNGLYF